jgi:uncharacterized membrane protein
MSVTIRQNVELPPEAVEKVFRAHLLDLTDGAWAFDATPCALTTRIGRLAQKMLCLLAEQDRLKGAR